MRPCNYIISFSLLFWLVSFGIQKMVRGAEEKVLGDVRKRLWTLMLEKNEGRITPFSHIHA